MKDLQADIIEPSDEVLEELSSYNNFKERSEVAQEIISRKPDFFEKWSLLIFLVLLMLLFTGTWFIRYPDIIEASAVLTSDNAPKEIISRQSGRITALFVKNNQPVKQGDIIGWVESNAVSQEIIDLSEKLASSFGFLEQNDAVAISELFRYRFKNLGELQMPYQTFITALQQYDDYMVNGFYYKRKEMLQSDIVSLSNIKRKTATQRSFTQKENDLARRTFEMNEILYKEKVISAEEYRQAQAVLMNKQKTEPQIEVSIISQENQIRDKQKEIDQLNHDIFQQQQIFEQALHTLKSNVNEWIRQYTIQAPVDGQVIFVLPIQQNQYIEQGRLLGYVNPPDSKYYVEVKLPQNNFGKVDTGMKVQLRFHAYPYQEAGFVPGTLSYVSTVAIDSGFLGTVRLDKGFITNQNKKLPYKPGLKAQALIVTKDMRLLERLYYNIVRSTSIKK
ncbi:MAG TPA: HlyD family efflux transporter periplasmic adaptor subunit [Niabella sp.]|nr:HlyD family efflux transporter periplasmic adaptor subunit [Niabella sp.]